MAPNYDSHRGSRVSWRLINVGKLYAKSEKFRGKFFSTCEEDRPLIVQFGGDDPDVFLKACQLVEGQCDAVDINLGGPQKIARKGNYGAFLLNQQQTIVNLIKNLNENLKVPVTCKIRGLRREQETLDLCKKIEDAGCSMLTVHGRTKEHNKRLIGPSNWKIIKKIKESLSIPVIANGGIRSIEDFNKGLEYTGGDGVMTSEAILENPSFFDPSWPHIEKVMLEYIELGKKYDENFGICKGHLYKSMYSGFKKYPEIRKRFDDFRELSDFQKIVEELAELRKDEDPKSKIEWYQRYWKEHAKEEAHSEMEYSQFIEMMDLRTKVIKSK